MNLKTVLPFLFLLWNCCSDLQSQPVPYAYSWTDFGQHTGYDGQAPLIRRCHHFFDLLDSLQIPRPGFEAGHYVIDQEIQLAVDAIGRTRSHPDSLDVLYFPAATYRLQRMVVLERHNLVIKGAGADQTLFEWVGPQQFAFNIIGKDSLAKGGVPVIGQERHHYFEMPSETRSFASGDWAVLTRNDPGRGCDTTFMRQFVRVKGANERQVFFDDPLRIDYFSEEHGARVHKLVPLMNVGLENFKVDATLNDVSNRAGSMQSNMAIQFAANCWIKGVESEMGAFQHVILDRASNIEVSGCYFHAGHSYEGGQGYGINLQNGTGECMVLDNIFATLRHAILLQRGANGNAVAYNYCTDSQDNHGHDDLIFHGGHAFRNLVEGNSVEHLRFDLRQCNNGPFNVVFRNRARRENVESGSWPLSAGRNIAAIGNESKQCMFLVGNSHVSWDNDQDGFLCCCGNGNNRDETPIGHSLLFERKPDFIPDGYWPLFGPDSPAEAVLPAEDRFLNAPLKTVAPLAYDCEGIPPFNASFTYDPCQTLQDGAFTLEGEVQLQIQGGIPPYSVDWIGEDVVGTGFEALYWEARPWSALVYDQSGDPPILLSGTTPECEVVESGKADPTELSEAPQEFSASVYPNPLQEQTTLRLLIYRECSLQVALYRADGQQLKTWTWDALRTGAREFDLDLPPLSPGVYFLYLQGEQQSQGLRLVK